MLTLDRQEQALLERNFLFQNMKGTDLHPLFSCLKAWKQHYQKNEIILSCGLKAQWIGIVLSGGANITHYDYWGKRHIISALRPGDLFGESYAVMPQVELEVDVQATEKSTILFLDVHNMTRICSNACAFHSQLVTNLVTLLASKNLHLNRKLRDITQPTLRNKILSYLTAEALRQHSVYFDIPFNRQELADYLNADRSALSNELSKMKKEGILDFQKNHFKLKPLKQMRDEKS